jgi:acyl-CoA dehydrogenase-like protein
LTAASTITCSLNDGGRPRFAGVDFELSAALIRQGYAAPSRKVQLRVKRTLEQESFCRSARSVRCLDVFNGEDIWCQLFSEPTHGSDVAGIPSRAIRDGDDWIVNGQKVWTSFGHLARYGLLLTRTDPDVPKHLGLS